MVAAGLPFYGWQIFAGRRLAYRCHTGTLQTSGYCICRRAARRIRFVLSSNIVHLNFEERSLLPFIAFINVSYVNDFFARLSPVAGIPAVDNGIPTALLRNPPHTEHRLSDNEPFSVPSSTPGKLQAVISVTENTRVHDLASSPAVVLETTPASQAFEIAEREEASRGERPMSPGTLALMCDEKDPLLTAPSSPSHDVDPLYVDQERVILSEFRDCLRRIISLGNRRGQYLQVFKHRSMEFSYITSQSWPFLVQDYRHDPNNQLHKTWK